MVRYYEIWYSVTPPPDKASNLTAIRIARVIDLSGALINNNATDLLCKNSRKNESGIDVIHNKPTNYSLSPRSSDVYEGLYPGIEVDVKPR